MKKMTYILDFKKIKGQGYQCPTCNCKASKFLFWFLHKVKKKTHIRIWTFLTRRIIIGPIIKTITAMLLLMWVVGGLGMLLQGLLFVQLITNYCGLVVILLLFCCWHCTVVVSVGDVIITRGIARLFRATTITV